MAKIAAKTTPRLFASARGRLLRAATAFAALCAATAALVGGAAVGPAAADTIGGAGITGYGVLNIFQLPTPTNFDPTNPTPIDLRNTGYSAVRNDYIGFVMGLSGSYSRRINADVTLSVTVPGRFTFGNAEGSVRPEVADDFTGLTGDFQTGGAPLWPLAGSWTQEGSADASGYVALLVDGTEQILGATGLIESRFENNELVNTYRPTAGVEIQMRVRLYRATAQIRFIANSIDGMAHTLSMQFTTLLDTDLRFVSYFLDPNRGQSLRTTEFVGANVPDMLQFSDQRANPTYFARAMYRLPSTTNLPATPPDRVVIANSNNFVVPQYRRTDQPPALLSEFQGNPTLASYWDNINLTPGVPREIVTYFGNGAPTEELSQDFVLGTEAVESLKFNTAAALNRRPGATNPTPADVTPFYAPSTFSIFGSIYNQTLDLPGEEVVLNNVTMSVTLPRGLRFAVTNPTTGARDVSSKVYGNVRGDSETGSASGGPLSWLVEPTGEEYGALTYQLTVSAPPVGSRTITRTIHVPAAPIKTLTANDFNLISFPFEFDPVLSNNGNAATILNSIVQPPDTQLNIFEYDKSVEDYRIARQLRPGVAYFYRPEPLNPDGTRTVYLRGARPVSNQAPLPDPNEFFPELGTPFQFTLNRGWNMIGNPYVYDIPLAFLRFVPLESNPTLQAFSYTEAVSNNFVRGAVFFYAGNGNYDLLTDVGAPLRPWVGYWIYVNQPVTVIFSTPGQLNTAILPAPITDQNTDPFPATRKRGQGDIASGRALVRRPTMNNWKLQFVTRSRSGERRDTATLIGVGAGAKDGDDVRDLLKPPAFKDYVYVGVSRGEGRTGRLMQDLKAPDGAKKTWDLEVESDHDGPVTIAWPNVAALPRTLRLRVTDAATGRTYDLRSLSSLTLNVRKNEIHRLRVTADRRLSKPLALSNVTATEVGGRGMGAAAMKIDFDVNVDAAVMGQVRNLAGKVVSTIVPSRAVGAGKQTLRWNRRSNEGNALPAGPYMLELTARTDDGEQVTVRRPMTLLR